jgi:hypothetical protein
MSNGSWRARIVTNLSSWLVQEGPLEQVGCECCVELNCTAENYKICTRRLEAFETAKAKRQDTAPESMVRVKQGAPGSSERNDGSSGNA